MSALPLTLLTGAPLDSFPGLLLYVPGALFELILPILLLVRGFQNTAERRRGAGASAGTADLFV